MTGTHLRDRHPLPRTTIENPGIPCALVESEHVGPVYGTRAHVAIAEQREVTVTGRRALSGNGVPAAREPASREQGSPPPPRTRCTHVASSTPSIQGITRPPPRPVSGLQPPEPSTRSTTRGSSPGQTFTARSEPVERCEHVRDRGLQIRYRTHDVVTPRPAAECGTIGGMSDPDLVSRRMLKGAVGRRRRRRDGDRCGGRSRLAGGTKSRRYPGVDGSPS